MAFDHSKFLNRFVEEAREHCSRIGEGLLNLENTPGDAEMLNGLFRSAHTIKGSSRMMKLNGVTELAHKMEDVLDAVRGGKIHLNQPVSTLLFRGVDSLTEMLDKITGGDKSVDAPEDLCLELAKAADGINEASPLTHPVSGQPTKTEPAIVPAVQPPPSKPSPPPSTQEAPVKKEAPPAPEERKPPLPVVKGRQADYLRINAAKLDDLVRLMGEIVSEHGRFRRYIGRLRDIERAVSRQLNAVAKHLESSENRDTALIDATAALALSLRQEVRAMYDASLMQDHLVGDLQETSLKLCMQPLSTVFDPLRRTVRELANEHGKDINFVVDGGETEMDRKIIDRIGDSLIHMIRNSLDHGLESSTDERIAAGKPPKGTIALLAYYDSGCVTISLSDDGKGLSADKIREKALSKRLFDEETMAGMSQSEITNLIFMPGFSTSPIITDLSGRGVGMDVVRRSIVDELKGTIVIETKEGKGTTFLLRLPLNLAIFPLFFISANGKICALPATSLVEMLSVGHDDIIEIVHKRAIRLREQIIPVENLSSILKLGSEDKDDEKQALIVIVRDGEEKLGLVVDEILGREEMVVKPLPSHIKNIRMVSGVTIGERNSIINVLHVPEVIKMAREVADPGKIRKSVTEKRSAKILVVDDSINTREIERSILEAYGYSVVTGEDGEDGWEKTRQTQFDMVITDVEMPRLDGFSFTERLRSDEVYRNVPVIIVTSREKEEDKKRGIQVGANAYIVKGAFDQSNLIETVKTLIG
jgi:two-component system chemotaxis sensor kinase CheA